jgi:hypothetical protein
VLEPRGSGPFPVSRRIPRAEPDIIAKHGGSQDNEQRHAGTCTPDLQITEVLLYERSFLSATSFTSGWLKLVISFSSQRRTSSLD